MLIYIVKTWTISWIELEVMNQLNLVDSMLVDTIITIINMIVYLQLVQLQMWTILMREAKCSINMSRSTTWTILLHNSETNLEPAVVVATSIIIKDHSQIEPPKALIMAQWGTMATLEMMEWVLWGITTISLCISRTPIKLWILICHNSPKIITTIPRWSHSKYTRYLHRLPIQWGMFRDKVEAKKMRF